MDGGAWWAAVHGVAKSRTRLSDFPFTFHFHALEKEMATHSCSWLENPRDGGASWAAIYGVAQSWTRLKQLSSSRKIIGGSRWTLGLISYNCCVTKKFTVSFSAFRWFEWWWRRFPRIAWLGCQFIYESHIDRTNYWAFVFIQQIFIECQPNMPRALCI